MEQVLVEGGKILPSYLYKTNYSFLLGVSPRSKEHVLVDEGKFAFCGKEELLVEGGKHLFVRTNISESRKSFLLKGMTSSELHRGFHNNAITNIQRFRRKPCIGSDLQYGVECPPITNNKE
eukprot:scaffold667_cov117-Cylindrotheca_fusiformis.AAC.2